MKTNTIRLVYPQWQGGNIAQWLKNLSPEDASRGYYLGSMLLQFLAPKSTCQTYTVPVSTDIAERQEQDGVLDRDIIAAQTKAAEVLINGEIPKGSALSS